mmetsp:Transcript_8523/g.22021  ORF Transcript_8523/g.22021 Transcript_8523/m.22021 type:complete len:205 (-) Transcript_8523:454-1068(-)
MHRLVGWRRVARAAPQLFGTARCARTCSARPPYSRPARLCAPAVAHASRALGTTSRACSLAQRARLECSQRCACDSTRCRPRAPRPCAPLDPSRAERERSRRSCSVASQSRDASSWMRRQSKRLTSTLKRLMTSSLCRRSSSSLWASRALPSPSRLSLPPNAAPSTEAARLPGRPPRRSAAGCGQRDTQRTTPRSTCARARRAS